MPMSNADEVGSEGFVVCLLLQFGIAVRARYFSPETEWGKNRSTIFTEMASFFLLQKLRPCLRTKLYLVSPIQSQSNIFLPWAMFPVRALRLKVSVSLHPLIGWKFGKGRWKASDIGNFATRPN